MITDDDRRRDAADKIRSQVKLLEAYVKEAQALGLKVTFNCFGSVTTTDVRQMTVNRIWFDQKPIEY